MKKKKRLLAILLAVILSVSATACSNPIQQSGSTSETTSSKRITPEDVKERVINQATEYLKKNYPDDNFTIISAASPNWADNYYKVGFKTEKYNNQQVMVYGSSSDKKDEDGFTIYTYSDDYYQYYMKDDAEKYFYDLSKKYLGEDIVVKVDVQTAFASTKNTDYDYSKTFIENYRSTPLFLTVYIFSVNSYEVEKNNIYDLLNTFIDEKISIRLKYIYVKNTSYIINKKIDEIINNIDRYCLEKSDFTTYKGVIKEY